MRRILSHPAFASLLAFAVVVVGGFVAMALSWRVAARTLDVSTQVPTLVSGGIGGLLLVVVGTSLFVVQAGRARAAEDRADADELLDRMSEVVQALRAEGGAR